MQLPFLGRSYAPFELDELDDELAETAAVATAAEGDLQARKDPIFALQKIESALIRAHLESPEVLTEQEYRRLRYLISFARLSVFEPGAAGPGGTRGRGDVTVDLGGWTIKVANALRGPLRVQPDPTMRLIEAREVLERLADEQDELRKVVADRHANDFSLDELDAEVGYKAPVLVLGGGGGAGFVYIGAMSRMNDEGFIPSYVIGSSIGAVMDVFTRELPMPLDEYIAWAKTISYRSILGPETLKRLHGLFGVFSLRFNEFAHLMFQNEDGSATQMKDQAIPFDTVVSGVREQTFERLPGKFRRAERAAMYLRTLPVVHIGMGPAVAARLWQVGAFIDSRIVKPIVLGGDDLTREFNVVDAAGFSAAIPGVLHHESADPRMWPLLDQLLEQKEVGALVDGGAASNVPVELAWKRVQDGRIGTRNAAYIALDCFHPQWDPRHLWLQPITQAISVQLVRNAPYADHLLQISPTLSPANLAPSETAFDKSVGWGERAIEPHLPLLARLAEPAWWEGEEPPTVGTRKTARAGASSVASILAAAASQPVNAVQRFRNRHFS